jgi:hypothetical protein
MSAFDRHIGHQQHFDRGNLKALIEQAGFHNCRVMTSGFPFFNLYRLTVIARGRLLIQDVSSQQEGGSLPWVARLVMRLFGILFNLNAPNHLPGWQLVAVARK